MGSTLNILWSQNTKIADSLLQCYYQNGDNTPQQKMELLFNALCNLNDADTIYKYSEILINIARNNDNNSNYQIKGFFYLGIANNRKGDINNALNALFKSAKLARQNNHTTYLTAIYSTIGDVYSISKNHKTAIDYYRKAIVLAREFNDSSKLASILLNTGAEFHDINKADSSFFYYKEARNIFKALNNEVGLAYAEGSLGDLYSQKGELEMAEKYISSAVATLEKYNDSYALSVYYNYLSLIYKKRKDLIPALEYAQISLSIAQQANLLLQQRDAYEILTELYALKGDLKEAFENQSKYITTRDSINNEEKIREMANMRTEYEVAQKQAEVDLLNNQRKNQRFVVLALFFVLALTIGILLIYYISALRRKTLTKKLVQRQQELEDQKEKLEELNQTKDHFFSIISHDLRGPINVLNGTTMLIRDFLESKNYEELDELTINMEQSVKKVQYLLDNLLEWAVSQQGKFPYKPERIDMDTICENVLNIFISMAATKSIDLTYEIKSNARFFVADKNSLMTIIRNLVNNALKFTNKNGAVQINTQQENNQVCISVSDNGVGIAEDRMISLFKIVDNKSTWGTEREKGLGIGLSLVYEFVKLNKGTIKVESTENLGTTFKVYLPMDPEAIAKPLKLQKKGI